MGRQKFQGYVDIGTNMDDDRNNVATEPIVFMVVSLDSHRKIPCSYIFINRLSAKKPANLVKLCLNRRRSVCSITNM